MLPDGKRVDGVDTPTREFTVLYEGPEHEVKGGQIYRSIARFTEIKRANDIVVFHFMTPTRNPVLNIDVPPEFDHYIEFGTANEKSDKAQYRNTYTLNGTYFPHQRMTVRWWRKSQTEARFL